MSEPPLPSFDVVPLQVQGVTVLQVSGELDLETAPRLEAAIVAASPPLVLDLEALAFIDSTGLRVIVAAATADRRLAVVCIPESPPARVFALAGLASVLSVLPTREAALAAARTDPTAGTRTPAA